MRNINYRSSYMVPSKTRTNYKTKDSNSQKIGFLEHQQPGTIQKFCTDWSRIVVQSTSNQSQDSIRFTLTWSWEFERSTYWNLFNKTERHWVRGVDILSKLLKIQYPDNTPNLLYSVLDSVSVIPYDCYY